MCHREVSERKKKGQRVDLSFNPKTEISSYAHHSHRVSIGIGTKLRPGLQTHGMCSPILHMKEEDKGDSDAPLCMKARFEVVHFR